MSSEQPTTLKENPLATLVVQVIGLCAAVGTLLWVRRMVLVRLVGIVWLFWAFQLFYRDKPLHLYISWPWNTRPVWLDCFQRGWLGFPSEVLVQGVLLLWVAAVAAALGWRLLRRIRPSLSAADCLVWGSGLVLGAWGMGVFFIGVAGGLGHARLVFGGLLAVLTGLAVWTALRAGETPAGRAGKMPALRAGETPALRVDAMPALQGFGITFKSLARCSKAEWGVLGVLGALHLLTLLYALTPSIESDALRYHLAAPQEWLKAGRIAYLPYNAFSNFPSTVEMLFLFGLGLAGDLLAQGFHFLFLPLTTAAVALITREVALFPAPRPSERNPEENNAPRPSARNTDENNALRPSERDTDENNAPRPEPFALFGVRPPFLAALTWGTLPLVIPLAGWAWIDLAVLHFTLGMVFFLLRWARTRERGDWILAAVFGGLLCASKYTGVVAVFWGAILLVLFHCFPPRAPARAPLMRTSARAALMRAAAFGMLAAAIASPWWIKNAVYTGNPVYPMAYGVFGGGEWSRENAAFYVAKTREKGIRPAPGEKVGPAFFRDLLFLPWLTASDPDRFEGFVLGPFFWVFFPWILAGCLAGFGAIRARPAPAMAACWGLFFAVFWFFSYQSNRFLLPGWAIGTAFAVSVLTSIARRSRVLAALCAAGFVLPVAFNLADSTRWLLFDVGKFGARREGTEWVGVSRALWPAYATGYLSRNDYLAAYLNYARAAEFCNATLRPADKVLLVGEHRKMHWTCRVEGNDWYDRPRILPYLEKARDSDALLDALLADGFTHIFFNLDEWGWPADPKQQLGETPPAPGAAWHYNRRFFSKGNVALLRQLLDNSRLQVLQSSPNKRIYVARIQPPPGR